MKKTPAPKQSVLKHYSKQRVSVKPRILFYDLEISSMQARVWNLYEANAVSLQKEWYIMCFSWNWNGGKTHVLAQPDFPGYKPGSEDDSRLVKKLHELFNQADITVAHNNKGFDKKRSNTRFIKYKLSPPTPSKTYDTLIWARRYFNFPTNKLGGLAKFLGIGTKLETGGNQLWERCYVGDMSGWRLMKRYCKHDTELLKPVFDRLLPWTKESFASGIRCPKPLCGSYNLENRGQRITLYGYFKRYQCRDCGGWCSERKGQKINSTLVTYD